MTSVRNCGCDEISDSDTSKYDSNRHYFACHLFTFDCNSPRVADTKPETAKETKEDCVDIIERAVEEEDLNIKFDDFVTKVLDNQVIDSGYQSIDLNTTFDDWMTKVLDNEVGKTTDLKKKINESLSRQLQDGLLSYNEYIDLEYIGILWIRLLDSIPRYHLGCVVNKRNILSVLLELFELKQISKTLFIESVLQL